MFSIFYIFVVSKAWLSRLITAAHPGPISNWDFACEHCAIVPMEAPIQTVVIKVVYNLANSLLCNL